MAQNKREIYVYAHWQGLPVPKLMGTLTAHAAKGKKAFDFAYDSHWLQSEKNWLIDPDLQFFSGNQFPNQKENFGISLDSIPDNWGRTLMKRRAVQQAKERNENTPTLYDIDFLLGVYDESRMGALRFKTDPNGKFLDDNNERATPPWSTIRTLQNAAAVFEEDGDNKDIRKWMAILIAPGSSLGGARPKANILDENNEL